METLKKVKLQKSGNGLYVEHDEPNVDNTGNYKIIPHEDLIHAIKELIPFLAWSHNLTPWDRWSGDLFSPEETDAVKVLKKQMKETTAWIMSTIDVSGISLSGEGEMYGCIITGTHDCNGTKCALNSVRIVLSRDVFHWEDDLKKVVDKIRTEVHAYLAGTKKGEAKPIEEVEGNLFTKKGGKEVKMLVDEKELKVDTEVKLEVSPKSEKPKAEKPAPKKSAQKPAAKKKAK